MADNEEVEIPDSDDEPEDEGVTEADEPVADDEPHGHDHTPGYPNHRHAGDGIAYDAGQVNVSGGLDLYPEERHDSDSAQATLLNEERTALADLTPLADGFVTKANELGWVVASYDHPGSQGGSIFGLEKPGSKPVSVTIAYTE